jgi:hypothetical protein
VSITDRNSFSNAVDLSVSGLPEGVTATFTPATTMTSSSLTVTASPLAKMGWVTLTITGGGGSLKHSATAKLQIKKR